MSKTITADSAFKGRCQRVLGSLFVKGKPSQPTEWEGAPLWTTGEASPLVPTARHHCGMRPPPLKVSVGSKGQWERLGEGSGKEEGEERSHQVGGGDDAAQPAL